MRERNFVPPTLEHRAQSLNPGADVFLNEFRREVFLRDLEIIHNSTFNQCCPGRQKEHLDYYFACARNREAVRDDQACRSDATRQYQDDVICRSKRSMLIEQYFPLAKQSALKVAWLGMPTYVEVDDLAQELTVYLIGLIETFDPRRGVPIEAYIRKCFRHRILNMIRDRRRKGAPVDPTTLGEGEPLEVSEVEAVPSEFQKYRALLTADEYAAVLCCGSVGLTTREAAARLGVTHVAISKRLKKAYEKLSNLVNRKAA